MDKALDLIKKLGQSDDYFERQKAAWALVELGEPAIDIVAEALENGEFSDLRYKSAWILGKIGNERAVQPLSRAMLNDSDHVVREWCAAALEALGSHEAVGPLVLAVKRDSSKDVRLRAAVALRKLGAADALRELLGSSEPETRGMAVTGLGKIKCQAA
ncbi:MAG: HEAT repeat domain-containing protein, partial [Methanothrix sp.]|nr:HEAT repeat domain-containing protein [Methanothrix sp.]